MYSVPLTCCGLSTNFVHRFSWGNPIKNNENFLTGLYYTFTFLSLTCYVCTLFSLHFYAVKQFFRLSY